MRAGIEAGVGMLSGDHSFDIYSIGTDLWKVRIPDFARSSPMLTRDDQECYSNGTVVTSGRFVTRDLHTRGLEQELLCPPMDPVGIAHAIFDALA